MNLNGCWPRCRCHVPRYNYYRYNCIVLSRVQKKLLQKVTDICDCVLHPPLLNQNLITIKKTCVQNS